MTDKISITIGDRSYQLDASDTESLARIEGSDREKLISLLEALNSQGPESKFTSPAHQIPSDSPQQPINENISAQNVSKGDIDAMVATLMAEERSKRKTGFDQGKFLKVIAGVAIAIVLLIIIF